jgi:hypothetical protein
MFDFVRRGLETLAEDMARQSREWKIQCMSCGRQKSVASLGGVRYGAAGTSYTIGLCSGCNGLRMMRIYRSRPKPENLTPSA